MERSSQNKSSLPTIILFVMVAILVVAGLLLPPISLGERLFQSGYERLGADTPQLSHPDGLVLSADAASLSESVRVKLESIPQVEFVSGQVPEGWEEAVSTLPPYVSVKSPVYSIELQDDVDLPVHLAVGIPNDSEPYYLLDLYTWDGTSWQWAPSELDLPADTIVTDLATVPRAVVVVQAVGRALVIGMSADPGEMLPPEVSGLVTELYPGGLYLGEAGVLMGETADFGEAAAQLFQFPTSKSQGSSQVQALLANPAAIQAHVGALTSMAVSGGYTGLNLDYGGVGQAEGDAFTQFVSALSDQLRLAGLALVVTVPAPTQLGPGSWDTAGYDWPALVDLADRLLVTLPLDPASYAADGPVSEMLEWAVRRVNRYQLMVGVSAEGIQEIGGVFNSIDGSEALALLNESLTRSDEGETKVEPGSQVVVEVPTGLVAPDPATGGYLTTYEVEGQVATVWFPGGSLLAHKLEAITGYYLGGIVLDGLAGSDIATELVTAINSFLSATAPSGASVLSLTWMVEDANGAPIGELPGDLNNPEFAWQVVDSPGTYSIVGKLAIGQQVADLGAVQVAVVESEPTPTPTPEPTATPETSVEDDTTPPPATATDADAVVSGDVVNLREGPGTEFNIVSQLSVGTALDIQAVNPEQTWLRIVSAGGEQGWIFAQLCSVNVNLADQPVETVPTPTPAPTNTPAPTPEGGAAPPPAAPPPAPSGGFELGGHIRSWDYLGEMGYAGMNWVKLQVHYGQDASGMVAAAHGNGFKIQLSALGDKGMVNKSNFHNDYGAWVAGMAAAGADAIEVWNEPNIEHEWPLGQIDPGAYTQLLCASYNAIKSANPGTAVISAAPAPTGYFGGCSVNGCDDLPWLQGMYNAGAANCMDYIGAHHNAGATSPSARSGHPADGGGGHHSWYFLPQTELYYATFGGTRKLFYTEMGYASQEGVPTFSDWFGWARGIDNAEQAAWLAESVTLSRTTGMVRCIIVWNLDFGRYGDDPQDGFAIIRPDGSCPACSSLRAAMGL